MWDLLRQVHQWQAWWDHWQAQQLQQWQVESPHQDDMDFTRGGQGLQRGELRHEQLQQQAQQRCSVIDYSKWDRFVEEEEEEERESDPECEPSDEGTNAEEYDYGEEEFECDSLGRYEEEEEEAEVEEEEEDLCESGADEDEAGPAEGSNMEERLERNRERCVALLHCSRESTREAFAAAEAAAGKDESIAKSLKDIEAITATQVHSFIEKIKSMRASEFHDIRQLERLICSWESDLLANIQGSIQAP